MNGFHIDLERATIDNTNFRRVLYTAHHCQLVLMSIAAGEEIGEETHHLDQFIRIEAGEGEAFLDGERVALSDGSAIVIPAGVRHNVVNTGAADLKLYSLYAPAEHKDGTVHATKADAHEEHFDGVVSAGVPTV
jgi:mannose-6-phosphate isomerase-like protein (cupin superfamily)